MHQYRTHNCGQLRLVDKNKQVRLSGWVHRKRDHGNLLFIDLRDNYGITQCVIDGTHSLFEDISKLSNESVLTIIGEVIKRSEDAVIVSNNTKPPRATAEGNAVISVKD